jgi:hypothetical protein
MPKDHLIHAVAFRSDACWVAQCLEYDIATQAKSLYDLLYEVERILVAHLLVAKQEGIEPFANIPKAPRRYWEMYKNGKPLPDATPVELPLLVEERPKLELSLAA